MLNFNIQASPDNVLCLHSFSALKPLLAGFQYFSFPFSQLDLSYYSRSQLSYLSLSIFLSHPHLLSASCPLGARTKKWDSKFSLPKSLNSLSYDWLQLHNLILIKNGYWPVFELDPFQARGHNNLRLSLKHHLMWNLRLLKFIMDCALLSSYLKSWFTITCPFLWCSKITLKTMEKMYSLLKLLSQH